MKYDKKLQENEYETSQEVSINNDEINIEKTEIDALNDKILELNDKYLRIAAELENTRRRASLDIESIVRNRAISISEKFLPLIDAIDAASLHSPDDEGIRSLSKAAISTLATVGIVKIESIGEQLNPMFHNAIQVIDVKESEKYHNIDVKPNTIINEMQSGYMFGDTLLRSAMVIVAK